MKQDKFPLQLGCFALSRRQIETGLTRLGEKPVRLSAMRPADAANALEAAMSRVVVPTDQMVDMAEGLIADIRTHYADQYATALQLRQGLNRQRSEPAERGVTMLTGLAGTGKSVFIRLLTALLTEKLQVDPGLGYSRLTFDPVRFVRFESVGSNKSSLRQISRDPQPGRLTGSQTVRLLEQELYRSGTGLLIVDELQFRSTGSAESLATINLLKQILQLDVPFAYGTNFSLAHKILKNPQEISNRLMRRLVVLRPPDPEDHCLGEIFREYQRITEGVVPTDARFRRLVYDRTFGLHRSRIVLLRNAYLMARKRGAEVISANDVESAYNSEQFHVFRSNVQDLYRLALSSSATGIRDDLRCPFGVDLSLPPSAITLAEEVTRAKFDRATVIAAMSPAEVRAMAAAEKELGIVTKPTRPRPAKRPPKSLENLQQAALARGMQ